RAGGGGPGLLRRDHAAGVAAGRAGRLAAGARLAAAAAAAVDLPVLPGAERRRAGGDVRAVAGLRVRMEEALAAVPAGALRPHRLVPVGFVLAGSLDPAAADHGGRAGPGRGRPRPPGTRALPPRRPGRLVHPDPRPGQLVP